MSTWKHIVTKLRKWRKFSIKFAVIVFPGSNCDADMLWAVQEIMGVEAAYVRYDEDSLSGFDGVLLPGGFSYGDYLRCGAIARFSTIMQEVIRFSEEGKQDYSLVFYAEMSRYNLFARQFR